MRKGAGIVFLGYGSSIYFRGRIDDFQVKYKSYRINSLCLKSSKGCRKGGCLVSLFLRLGRYLSCFLGSRCVLGDGKGFIKVNVVVFAVFFQMYSGLVRGYR